MKFFEDTKNCRVFTWDISREYLWYLHISCFFKKPLSSTYFYTIECWRW